MRIILKSGELEKLVTYVGNAGEIILNRGASDLCVMDGVKQGGHSVANIAYWVGTATIISPLEGSDLVSPTPVIQGSVYNGDGAHVASYWQIATDAAFTNLIYDSGKSTEHLIQLLTYDVPVQLLYQTQYYARVKYESSYGLISEWSTPVSFTTWMKPYLNKGTWTINENSTAIGTLTSVANGPVTYAIAGGADAAKFNLVNGVLSFKTAPNYEAPGSSLGTNVYKVDISLNDTMTTVTETVTVNIANVNESVARFTTTNAMVDLASSPSVINYSEGPWLYGDLAGTVANGWSNSGFWWQVKNVKTGGLYIVMNFKKAFTMTSFKWLFILGGSATNKFPKNVLIQTGTSASGPWTSRQTISLPQNNTSGTVTLNVTASMPKTAYYRFVFAEPVNDPYCAIQYFVPWGYE